MQMTAASCPSIARYRWEHSKGRASNCSCSPADVYKRQPLGSLRTNSSQLAALAAASTSSSVAPCLPRRMFSITVSSNPSDIDVVYEDENIIAVNKQAGVLSHAEKAGDDDTLIDRILSYLNEKGEYDPEKERTFVPALCNRLDRNTSGIVIAGKNSEALRQINEAVKFKSIKKYYKTLVCGKIEKSGRLEDFYEKDSQLNKAKVGGKEGKIITTIYRPLKTNGRYTLAEVELITGKSHQIRVHMASAGFPIIGDVKYGNKQENEYFRKKAGVKRQMLHAYKMVFEGLKGELAYLNGKTVTADVPKDFKCAEKEIFGI